MSTEIALAAKIENVSLDVATEDGVEHRKIGLKLSRDFDDALAAALGRAGRAALMELKSHGFEKAYINTEHIVMIGEMVGPTERVEVKRIWGKQAVMTASRKSDDPPAARLEFGCFYSDDTWGFVGRHGGGIVQLNLKPAQLELAPKAVAHG